MHDPADALRKDPDLFIRTTPHRFHSPRQTLLFVKHMANGNVYRSDLAHLISDYASDEIFVRDKSPSHVSNELEELRRLWSKFDIFVIEISTLREYIAQHEGKQLVVNSFSQRDQEKHHTKIEAAAQARRSVPLLPITIEHLTTGMTIYAMNQIKRALGSRPILWVSHIRPPSDAPEYDTLNKVRRHISATLCTGADRLGNGFFDPSDIARQMGQAAFFMQDGRDLDHMTPEAARILSGRYKEICTEILIQA